ncbi:MAG TPA: ABC transporter ATP-binding protein, partial [Mobilitalea sp.]|nr:ABC transporter ATP-binding protein [Mobilitalea sp.]
KTTLIKTIIGLFKNYDGEIIYKGKPIDFNDPVEMSSIGVLVDTVFHEDLSAYMNLKLLMMATPNKDLSNMYQEIMDLLKFVGLEKNAKDKVKSYSFGMKQRLALAQTLIGEPQLLILDEPFVGLDPLGIELAKEKLLTLCSEKKASVIFSSHQLSEVAEISDDIIVIDNGEIKYSGSYEQLSGTGRKYCIKLRENIREDDILLFKNYNISDSKDTITIDYDSESINEAIKLLYEKTYQIDQINILENSLIKLFKED